MNAPAPPERPAARSDVVFRRLDEEWVVFDPRTQRLHALNLTAAFVWELCTGRATVDEIATEVERAFETPPEREAVRRDVAEAVARFAREGLLA